MRAANAWIVLSLACALACKEQPSGSRPPPGVSGSSAASVASVASGLPGSGAPGTAAPLLDAAAPVGSSLPPEVVRELTGLRAAKLPLVAPREPLAGLAFGKACLAQALPDRVVFRELAHGEPLSEATLGAVRAIAARPGGGLLALGARGGARLEPNEHAARSLAAVAFLPGSWLLPDAEDATRFYVFYPSAKTLFRYELGAATSGMLPIAEQHTLEGYAGALTVARDGAFVYFTDHSALARNAPRGTRTTFPLPLGRIAPWRLLPAARLDEVWSVAEHGEVTRLSLAQGLPAQKSFRLSGQPFEAAANRDSLAFIVSAQTDGGPRSWRLVVLDFDGRERFATELPAPAISSDDAWYAELTRNRQLALSSFAPLVAVGGSAGVQVYDYRSKQAVFSR